MHCFILGQRLDWIKYELNLSNRTKSSRAKIHLLLTNTSHWSNWFRLRWMMVCFGWNRWSSIGGIVPKSHEFGFDRFGFHWVSKPKTVTSTHTLRFLMSETCCWLLATQIKSISIWMAPSWLALLGARLVWKTLIHGINFGYLGNFQNKILKRSKTKTKGP